MGLEQNNEQHYREVVDKYTDVITPVYNMTTRDYVVRPNIVLAGGPITLYLPPVADAKGRFYSIVARAAGPAAPITIHDMADSECWEGDVVMNGKCDAALFYSDGLYWHQIRLGRTFHTGAPGTAVGTTLAPTTGPV